MATRSWMFYGWIVIAAIVVVMALSSGTRMSFGVAMVPLSQQFGWTRTTLSTIVLVTGIITGLLQMTMGVLVDRYGPRRLIGIGLGLLGVGVWLLTIASTVWEFGLAYGLLVGVGLAATTQVVMSALVANWFVAHRGFAQAIIGSAPAVGWMLIVPINLYLERTYDWTVMYRTMGTVLLIGMVPLALILIRNRPEEMGLQALGEVASSGTAPASGAAPPPAAAGSSAPSLTLREALQSGRTWKLIYLGFA